MPVHKYARVGGALLAWQIETQHPKTENEPQSPIWTKMTTLTLHRRFILLGISREASFPDLFLCKQTHIQTHKHKRDNKSSVGTCLPLCTLVVVREVRAWIAYLAPGRCTIQPATFKGFIYRWGEILNDRVPPTRPFLGPRYVAYVNNRQKWIAVLAVARWGWKWRSGFLRLSQLKWCVVCRATVCDLYRGVLII